MDYQFENLGHERFQEFCTVLINSEFSNTQAFPVGQPDGGRDTLVYSTDKVEKEFMIFQVKFVKNPNKDIDIIKWLKTTIDGEVNKIEKLKFRGAKGYYLITNLSGSAHLDVGSKDKVNHYLENNVSLPAICWWRDDISRLIEKNPLIKWSFPEILNGQDVLNSVVFKNLQENNERRENVIKAYLADQYDIDNEVKFKQIDMQNKLFDLFTDVPLRIKKIGGKNKKLKRTLHEIGYTSYYNFLSADNTLFFDEDEGFGASRFLLHPKVQNDIERVLLEGGPGQGKSTISQYISQVHRARLLNKEEDIQSLPDHAKKSPIRLPFKLDLRHIALWVENKNPYQNILNENLFSSIWKNSLESFLVGNIIYHSQIEDFSSSDLLAIVKNSAILIVFDGFDEIADFAIRKEVIDLINRGVNRLSENARSLQILITSRPAAFSDSIGFSVDLYPHFELTDITPNIIREYVDKWVKASRLEAREGSEIKKLVEQKIELPHLRDLAKSPMQLAIFISLLRTRGESLPNKRTALYDSYIELFFNRESEKNSMIRTHRDLIIDIHQYLAWVLHSEAELLKTSGSIEVDTLIVRLKSYLSKEGHDTEIADQLFHVMKERVCALVSRVQGTYEFEVQPLREYFCAKFLYATSPYSPIGAEKKGTKPERFDAIARNFYWHNVVRFFAGCFDKGELPLLIQKLKELVEDEILKPTNYPRLLTSQVLSDWVFTQYPLLLKDAVKIILDGINIGNIINQGENYVSNERIIVPPECGRKEILDECFKQLATFPSNDYVRELIGIVTNNPDNILQRWKYLLTSIQLENIPTWLEYGYYLEILYLLDPESIKWILENCGDENETRCLQILIKGNAANKIEIIPHFKRKILIGILDGQISKLDTRNGQNSSLSSLSFISNPVIISSIFYIDSSSDESFITFLAKRFKRYRSETPDINNIIDFEQNDEIDKGIKGCLEKVQIALNQPISIWTTSILPWDTIVETLRSKYPQRRAIQIISVIAAGIKSKEETYDEFDDLTNEYVSLCKRVRCARLKSGSPKYWEQQLKNTSDLLFTLVVFFTWATPKTFASLSDVITQIISELSIEEYGTLAKYLTKTTRLSIFTATQKRAIESYIENEFFSEEVIFLLSKRISRETRPSFIYLNTTSDKIKGLDTSDYILTYLIDEYLKNPVNEKKLESVKQAYLSTKEFNDKNLYFNRRSVNEYVEIPIDIARKIMAESKKYPHILPSYAEKSCRLYANHNIIPVGKIAKDQSWFDD